MDPPMSLRPPVLEIENSKARQGHSGAREDDHINIVRVGLGDVEQHTRHGASNQVAKPDAAVQQACNRR